MTSNRSRSWRRLKNRIKKKQVSPNKIEKREKKWKLLYLRNNKIARAKQLGYEYPALTERQLLDKELPNLENK